MMLARTFRSRQRSLLAPALGAVLVIACLGLPSPSAADDVPGIAACLAFKEVLDAFQVSEYIPAMRIRFVAA